MDGGALKRRDGFIRSCYGYLHNKKTTRGWKLEVEWNYGTLRWIPLNYLKASNTIEISEYAVVNNIEDEPAFKLWVKDFLRKRYQIIPKVKAKYWITTHKFGIHIPKTVHESYKIDQQTGTTFCTTAI